MDPYSEVTGKEDRTTVTPAVKTGSRSFLFGRRIGDAEEPDADQERVGIMKRLPVFIFCGAALWLGVGCRNAAPTAVGGGRSEAAESATSNFRPFWVYKDKGTRGNHYIPSGFMPNGKCLSFSDTWREGCHDGPTCIRVVYDVPCSNEDQRWAGIYWLNPANNWGNRKGGYDLSGATKLTFWARGAQGGERIEEFKIGGITGDYPDTDSAVIGPVILTDEWRQYTIDLRGKDLSYISGGFSWSTSAEVNDPEGPCTFFLDGIRYE